MDVCRATASHLIGNMDKPAVREEKQRFWNLTSHPAQTGQLLLPWTILGQGAGLRKIDSAAITIHSFKHHIYFDVYICDISHIYM